MKINHSRSRVPQLSQGGAVNKLLLLLPSIISFFGLCFCPSHWMSCVESISHLSTQMGTFRSHDGDYFIEPLLSVDEPEDEEEQNKPHIIYRHSTPQRKPSTGRRGCDTSGICFLIKYRCKVDMGSLPHCKNTAAFLLFAEHHHIQYGLFDPRVR